MTKFVNLELSVQYQDHGNQRAFVVKPHHSSVLEWTLCLQLLSDGLVNEVIFKLDPTSRWFKSRDSTLKLTSSAQKTSVTSVTSSSQQDFKCSILKRDLLYIVFFFLKYYRDGYAEVDHIDIDANVNSQEGGYLTIQIELFAPPISTTESDKILAKPKK